MAKLYAFRLKVETEKKVFVAILSQLGIETAFVEDVAADHEIGSMKVSVAVSCATSGRVVFLRPLFVEIPKTPWLFVSYHRDAAVHHFGSCREIGSEEGVADNRHVAVEEEQPVPLCLGGEEVADGGTTHILAAADIAAAIQLVDAEVGDDGNLVAAAVVCHDDLVGQAADAVCLRLQRGDERVAAVVVGRKEYGEGFFQGSED